MRLAAALYTAVALDAITFAAVASVPGVIAYELNPLTRAIVGAVGLAAFTVVKLTGGAVAALLLLRPQRPAVRHIAAVIAALVTVGAASNLLGLSQLARGVM